MCVGAMLAAKGAKAVGINPGVAAVSPIAALALKGFGKGKGKKAGIVPDTRIK